ASHRVHACCGRSSYCARRRSSATSSLAEPVGLLLSRLQTVVLLICRRHTLPGFRDSCEQLPDALPMSQLSPSVDLKSRPITVSLRHLRLRQSDCIDGPTATVRQNDSWDFCQCLARQHTSAAAQRLNAI